MRRTPPILLLAALLLLAVLLVAGCGSDEDGGTAPATTAAESSDPGADDGGRPGYDGSGAEDGAGEPPSELPAALAANRAQANEILGEGSLEDKLAELEGFPVVVNQWASWCPPCRAEFPYFQQAAEIYADQIAFLGIDMQDGRDSAERFLAELPVPYPSVFDPDASAIVSLGGGIVSPTTVFIDAEGEVVDLFQGEYTSLGQLEADIEEHLLN